MPLVNRLINLFSTVATCTIHACTQYNIIGFFSTFIFLLFVTFPSGLLLSIVIYPIPPILALVAIYALAIFTATAATRAAPFPDPSSDNMSLTLLSGKSSFNAVSM